MMRLNRFKINFILVLLFFNTASIAYAQETSDLVLGGIAKCTFKGRVPVTKLETEANRLLLLQSEGITKGSIELQTFVPKADSIIDFNLLALLNEILDVDLFLNGEQHKFENNMSEFTISKDNQTTNKNVTVDNSFVENVFTLSKGKIRVIKNDDDTVTGSLRVLLNATSRVVSSNDETIRENDKNGKVLVRCKLIDIPLEIKEISF